MTRSPSTLANPAAPCAALSVPTGSALRSRITYILNHSTNKMNEADQIARIIEAEDKRKRGSMHLAVKNEMRRMETSGIVCVLHPRSRWDSYTLCLLPNTKGSRAEERE